MTAPNRNVLWCRALAQELARGGVAHACIAPGNRSGPLVFALAEQRGLRLWSHLDERSAGFFGLGLAKATGAPVALVCTTGTAAANFLPAVMEATAGRVPLVVLTADRPADLRDTGANQAVDQVGLYGTHARWSVDLPSPVVEERALRHVRAVAGRAVAAACGPPAGAVHVNVPLAKPLEPTVVPGDVPADFGTRFPLAAQGHPDGTPFAVTRRIVAQARAEDVAGLVAKLQGKRGVVVAGPQPDGRTPEAALALAQATGFPLLADPLSGLRFGPSSDRVLGAYDALLAVPEARAALRPEVVVRLGAPPTSEALLAWLEAAAPLQVVVDDDPSWRDPLHTLLDRVVGDPAAVCGALAGAIRRPAPEAWSALWKRYDRAAAEALARTLPASFSEAAVVAAALDTAPEGGTLFVSNSLPVRDLDRVGAPRPKRLRALGNRGASGIDGITSTALGVAAAGERVLLVTGDVAFLHDLPGLLAFPRLGVEATILVVHNDGGRIFDHLPAARFDPPFTEQFLTPHGRDLAHAAALVDAGYAQAKDAVTLGDALARAGKVGGAQVVEARVDPRVAKDHRAAMQAAVAEAVRHAR